MNIRATAGAPEIKPQPVERASRKTSIIHVPNLNSDMIELHRANIRRNLAHRIEMARQQGNVRLLRLLETELRELVPQ